jgi:hypothetical protein
MESPYEEIRRAAETAAQVCADKKEPDNAIMWLEVCRLAQENARLWAEACDREANIPA